jgi:hypothetical protein
MPQDKSIDAQGKEINPQHLSTKVEKAKTQGQVMPFDKVKVYATKKLTSSDALADITEEGQEMEVHPALAEKLIKSGKATEKATAKKDK